MFPNAIQFRNKVESVYRGKYNEIILIDVPRIKSTAHNMAKVNYINIQLPMKGSILIKMEHQGVCVV